VETTTDGPWSGLTDAEVRERVARGRDNRVPRTTSRTVGQIVLANVLTPFNALLGGLLVLILIVGPIQDALFGGVLIANAAIGIVQEIRAKRTLDRLTLLSAPRSRVVRESVVREVPVADVVQDDVLDLRPGDQLPVDGVVLMSSGLELDESLLTGESDTVSKDSGDEVLSGSFVASGGGRARATRVGLEAYARTIEREASRFSLVRSELRDGINLIVKLVAWAMIPVASLLIWSQLRSDAGFHDAIRGAVAGVVAMVPEGLVLLTSVAFAMAVTRLGRRQVLVQELPAVEGLARVDTLGIDKTGTLTEGRLALDDLVHLTEADEGSIHTALGALVAADPSPNATLRAIGEAVGSRADGWTPGERVAFSSARKWSGASFVGHGTWILGAPEVLLAEATPGGAVDTVRDRVAAEAVKERRVLLLQRSDAPLAGPELPAQRSSAALVLLTDRVRPDAADTMRYFEEQGVAVKVISGDSPDTVSAIARRVGIPNAEPGVDARELPGDPAALAPELERAAVFGRVTPQQKRAMVRALQSTGHEVAMTGDGVNDVLALKDADIGIAMGSGSDASRAVAKVVLLDGRFSSMPWVVAEGRRVLANIERTAKLFVTKTVYAMLLSLAVGVIGWPFPFLPRQLTVIGTLTIGIPAFVMTLEPSARRARPGFIRRVLRFAVPAGFMAAIGTFFAYAWVYVTLDRPLDQARTTATLALFAIGMAIVLIVGRPLTRVRALMIVAMIGAFALILAVPGLRTFYGMDMPPFWIWTSATLIAGAVALVVQLLIPGRLTDGLDDREDDAVRPTP
jgi:magnesium-transporting ATPase (P-type)